MGAKEDGVFESFKKEIAGAWAVLGHGQSDGFLLSATIAAIRDRVKVIDAQNAEREKAWDARPDGIKKVHSSSENIVIFEDLSGRLWQCCPQASPQLLSKL